MNDRYTFGDDERAGARLLRLAELYEPVTRELISRGGISECGLALDLGCGPGCSTRLLRDELRPARTVGLDASPRFVAEARRRCPGIEFELHDVTHAPFPVQTAGTLLCRFLLTHLRDVEAALSAWAGAAGPMARLLVHETESLSSAHPTLSRYYALLAQMQGDHGQRVDVGARLNSAFAVTPWRVLDSRVLDLEFRGADMASLHLPNLRTWRHDDFAKRTFDPRELDEMEASLERIAGGGEPDVVVHNGVRQIVAELDPRVHDARGARENTRGAAWTT